MLLMGRWNVDIQSIAQAWPSYAHHRHHNRRQSGRHHAEDLDDMFVIDLRLHGSREGWHWSLHVVIDALFARGCRCIIEG